MRSGSECRRKATEPSVPACRPWLRLKGREAEEAVKVSKTGVALNSSQTEAVRYE